MFTQTHSPKHQLQFASEVLEAQIFGAFWLAIEARRKEDGLTQNELSERTGRDKTNISKLLDGPRNWTLKTISDLAEALNLQVEFSLKDKKKPERVFTPTGVTWESVTEIPAVTTQAVTAANTAMPSYYPFDQIIYITQTPLTALRRTA